MLQIFNTLTKQKEILRPIEPGKVKMYVCGMTVYDHCHIGHARTMTVYDMVVRYLRACGYAVHYVRNITDIDDKIIDRAQKNGEDPQILSQRYITAMQEDSKALGLLPPDYEPRATESIDDMIAMIHTLIKYGYGYQGNNGDIYYDVSRFRTYGALSGKRLGELRAGARVGVEKSKHDPLDFVLWKRAKPGEPAWNSPWGKGRPGWHIECSAMSCAHHGPHFDIHGGGMDLKFPHHENEIAQSEAANGGKFVNIWMHNGFVQVDEKKMSKSLGNFVTVRDSLRHYRTDELRYLFFSCHYRSPLDYSAGNLEQARAAVTRLYGALRGLPGAKPAGGEEFRSRFCEAMDDDFNTPKALAVLADLVREIYRARKNDKTLAAGLGAELSRLLGLLGFSQEQPKDCLLASERAEESLSEAQVEALMRQRALHRKRGHWKQADEIRQDLLAAGIVVEDGPHGSDWYRS